MRGEYWLGDAHFGGLTTAHAWRLFSTATSLPLDFWSLDQKSIQDKTMGNRNKKWIKKINEKIRSRGCGRWRCTAGR